MISFRTQLISGDSQAIGNLLASTGFFYPYEIEVAKELSDTNLELGTEASGYHFIVAHEDEKVLGYCCFGLSPCTESSYDLYWIAVHKNQMNRGIGRKLMTLAENSIVKLGGTIVWVETSGRPLYESTRAFYTAIGYDKVAALPDFYAPGDDKIIFTKKVGDKK